jgi:hypothetical protein
MREAPIRLPLAALLHLDCLFLLMEPTMRNLPGPLRRSCLARHRQDLLQGLGLKISSPPNISMLTTCRVVTSLSEVIPLRHVFE